MRARIGWLLVLGLVACTTQPPKPQSVTDRATTEACRQQANNTYAVQNRDQIYRIKEPFAPQSGTGLLDLPTRGLSDQFAQERLVQDCIRNTGTQTSRAAPGNVGSGGGRPAVTPVGSATPSGAIPSSGSLSR
jgi:hypothetical protein